jgi:PAS domain S-box-containing protein
VLGESNRRASASKFWLAAVVDSSEDAIISLNLDWIITSWNRGAERLYGWTRQEALGQPITIIIPEELRSNETEFLNRIREGERRDQYDAVRVTKSGERRFVSLTISPVKDWTGTIVGASKFARDITERKQMEAKLQSANDTLEERVRARTAELWQKNNELVQQREVVQELSGRLLQLQDEERRRLARELHDSAGQLLSAMSMNISKIVREKEGLSAAAKGCVEENTRLTQQLSDEIRTMSYLLHPPSARRNWAGVRN